MSIKYLNTDSQKYRLVTVTELPFRSCCHEHPIEVNGIPTLYLKHMYSEDAYMFITDGYYKLDGSPEAVGEVLSSSTLDADINSAKYVAVEFDNGKVFRYSRENNGEFTINDESTNLLDFSTYLQQNLKESKIWSVGIKRGISSHYDELLFRSKYVSQKRLLNIVKSAFRKL